MLAENWDESRTLPAVACSAWFRHPRQVSGTCTVFATSPARMFQWKSPSDPQVLSNDPI
jgi:hypothetical protein